jgi:hypothetical protein
VGEAKAQRGEWRCGVRRRCGTRRRHSAGGGDAMRGRGVKRLAAMRAMAEAKRGIGHGKWIFC